MAKMIDDKPSFHGEAKTWESFQKLLPMEAIVYNNREINGREFDFCILWEGMGIFVVEVKGWLADKVTVLGVDNILVDGYDQPQKSPKKQARAYRFELLNKIVRKYNVSPIWYAIRLLADRSTMNSIWILFRRTISHFARKIWKMQTC